jgi:hypothetical protein
MKVRAIRNYGSGPNENSLLTKDLFYYGEIVRHTAVHENAQPKYAHENKMVVFANDGRWHDLPLTFFEPATSSSGEQ